MKGTAMKRYTHKSEDGRYYIESANGKLESDIKGHIFGKAIDYFAELENTNLIEIICCKDYKYYSDFDPQNCKRLTFHFCSKFNNITRESDYCSYGEKRTAYENK